MNFNLNDYETVESRIHRFWEMYPEGRLITELVHFDSMTFIVKASAYTDRNDPVPAATDYAHEVVGSSPVNKNFALENCVTISLGRVLSTLAVASKGQRPSREEMAKVIEMKKVKEANPLDWGVKDEVPLPPEPSFDPFQEWPNPQPARISEPNFIKMTSKQFGFMGLLFRQLATAKGEPEFYTEANQTAYAAAVLGETKDITELSSKECSAVIKALQKDLEAKK
jgi:hypothetical protein